MSNNLKFLKELDFKLNNNLSIKERIASKYISKLDGIINISEQYNLYNHILVLKEIINNNKIENINTTYKNMLYAIGENKGKTMQDKTTFYNIEAIKYGKEFIDKNGFINKQLLIKIQQIIRDNIDEIRKQPVVITDGNGKVVYQPPTDNQLILDYLDELEHYINNTKEFNNIDLLDNNSPLFKLAIIHYQFESIHPFNDGNGRTGRILNILYLILNKEIDNPIFSLSHYISNNKDKYYLLLNQIQNDTNKLNEFIEYFLDGIIYSSELGITIFKKLRELKQEIYIDLNKQLNKLTYDQYKSLFNNLMFNKELFKNTLNISINTASKYLSILVDNNILYCINSKSKDKKYMFIKIYDYINSLD